MSEIKLDAMWSGAKSRQIVERIVVEGTLVLETPAHLGGGDSDGATMTLLVDTLDETRPLLTGASIAGALRSYLWTRERGFGNEQSDKGREVSAAALLFGTSRKDDDGDGDQSRLIVDDAVGNTSKVVYRDGVRLDEHSRTAAQDALYSVQLWDAGTTFPLRFELLVSKEDAPQRDRLLLALTTALDGLAKGEITFGARKNRGYGRVCVDGWRLRTYQLDTLDGLMAWLREGGEPLSDADHVDDLATALGINADFGDARELFTLDAYFTLDGSLLIRSADDVTDMRQLSNCDGNPILSGTSIAGALRARAEKILNTLATDRADNQVIIADLFGSPHDQKKDRRASRITVEEHFIEGGVTDLVQSRVSIDRFTGGALDTALFDQQPVFGSAEAGVRIRLQLQQPKADEIGLLLLLLKDLWTGDLPLGGERSVGRGRLRGQHAELTYGAQKWNVTANDDGLNVEPDRESLNSYLQALLNRLGVAL